jgi:hypothetical protein
LVLSCPEGPPDRKDGGTKSGLTFALYTYISVKL